MLIMEMERKMAFMESMIIAGYMQNTNARMAKIEVAMEALASSGSHRESAAEKNKLNKEVLESKATSIRGKLMTSSEYRMWSKKF